MVIDLRNSYFSISDSVRETLIQDFTDHRSESFLKYIDDLQSLFCSHFNTKYCTFFQGSGSLSNEVMLEEISKKHSDQLGLILNHGEFGQRLVDSCNLRDLQFVEISDSYDTLYRVLQRVINENELSIRWILFPLCESSTGAVYNFQKIVSLCRQSEIKIYIDGMSYIGNAQIDLSQVAVFTGSSGKGLGSIPGIGILLYNEYSEVRSKVKYLDLLFYRQKNNVPFTISSVQIKALGASCRERLCEENYLRVSQLRVYIFNQVSKSKYISLEIPNGKFIAFFSFKVSQSIHSKKLGEFLESKNIFLSFRTQYLIQKNCIEISLLDLHTKISDLDKLFNLIEYYGENYSN